MIFCLVGLLVYQQVMRLRRQNYDHMLAHAKNLEYTAPAQARHSYQKQYSRNSICLSDIDGVQATRSWRSSMSDVFAVGDRRKTDSPLFDVSAYMDIDLENDRSAKAVDASLPNLQHEFGDTRSQSLLSIIRMYSVNANYSMQNAQDEMNGPSSSGSNSSRNNSYVGYEGTGNSPRTRMQRNRIDSLISRYVEVDVDVADLSLDNSPKAQTLSIASDSFRKRPRSNSSSSQKSLNCLIPRLPPPIYSTERPSAPRLSDLINLPRLNVATIRSNRSLASPESNYSALSPRNYLESPVPMTPSSAIDQAKLLDQLGYLTEKSQMPEL